MTDYTIVNRILRVFCMTMQYDIIPGSFTLARYRLSIVLVFRFLCLTFSIIVSH